MKKNLIIGTALFLLLININLLYAQTTQNKNDVNLYGILYTPNYPYLGSPYLFDSWSTGSVFLKNGTQANNVSLKFDRLSNQLIFYQEDLQKQFSADECTISGFTLTNVYSDSLRFIKYEGKSIESDLKQGDFVQLLYNGQMQLMVKYAASIKSSIERSAKDIIVQKEFYFLKFDSRTEKINLNLKSIVSLFPQKKKQIKELAWKQHFRKNNTSSMVKLISELDH